MPDTGGPLHARRAAVSLAFVALAWAVAPGRAAAQADEDEPHSGGATSSADAGAAERGPELRVYVVSVAMDESLEAVAQRAGAAARHTLRALPGVDWRGADQLFLGYDDSALSVLARARDRLAEGRQAFLDLDLPRSIDTLTGAVADFDAAAAALEDPQDLGDALLYLGASLAFEGRARDAQRVFARLHVQMPHVVPDAAVFPPEVISRFEAARPRDAGSPSASIQVESDPPGAIAYVDFVARGVTPIDVAGLVGGEHVVRVTRVGATPFVQSMSVRAGRGEATSAMLVDDSRTTGLADAVARVRDDDVAALAPDSATREIADVLRLDRIAVLRVSRGDLDENVSIELTVFDVASGRRLVRGVGVVPIDIGRFEPAVEQAVVGGLQAAIAARQADDRERVIPVERPPPIEAPPPPSEPGIAEQWWFWTIIGGVLVLGGVAAGVGVAASDTGPALGQSPGGVVVVEF